MPFSFFHPRECVSLLRAPPTPPPLLIPSKGKRLALLSRVSMPPIKILCEDMRLKKRTHEFFVELLNEEEEKRQNKHTHTTNNPTTTYYDRSRFPPPEKKTRQELK